MGIFSARSASDNPKYGAKPLSGRKAAKAARRGGSAISGTSSAPRPTRVKPVRGGSR